MKLETLAVVLVMRAQAVCPDSQEDPPKVYDTGKNKWPDHEEKADFNATSKA